MARKKKGGVRPQEKVDRGERGGGCLVPDPERVWSNFATYQLYSPDEVITKERVQALFSPPPSLEEKNNQKFSDVFTGKYFCDSLLAVEKCDPSNRLRVVKLGDTSSFKNLEQRTNPISVLRLFLVDQVLPLSNFYF